MKLEKLESLLKIFIFIVKTSAGSLTALEAAMTPVESGAFQPPQTGSS